MILVGSALLVGAKPGKRRRQSHQIGNQKEKTRPPLTLVGDLIAAVVPENQGLPHEMTLVLRNPSPGVEIVTIPGMEKGADLRLGIHTLLKGSFKRKNGSRNLDWEPLSGKEPTKFEPI